MVLLKNLYNTTLLRCWLCRVLYKKLPVALNLKSPEQLQEIIDSQTAALVIVETEEGTFSQFTIQLPICKNNELSA